MMPANWTLDRDTKAVRVRETGAVIRRTGTDLRDIVGEVDRWAPQDSGSFRADLYRLADGRLVLRPYGGASMLVEPVDA
jgi:hypothetical protein